MASDILRFHRTSFGVGSPQSRRDLDGNGHGGGQAQTPRRYFEGRLSRSLELESETGFWRSFKVIFPSADRVVRRAHIAGEM